MSLFQTGGKDKHFCYNLLFLPRKNRPKRIFFRPAGYGTEDLCYICVAEIGNK